MKPVLLLAVMLSAGGVLAQDAHILGPNPEACAADAPGPAVLVQTHGFKDRSGNVRVELYPAVDGDFLAPGSRLRSEGKVFQRIDVPTPPTGDALVCVVLPAHGAYAMSVLHDRNANSKLDVYSDGFGFPNNPRLGFKKPAVEKATFKAEGALTRLDVVLNYVSGFSARPLSRPK